jgi:hypothetical protein
MAGKAAQTSRDRPAKMSSPRPVASMARATRVVVGVDRRAVDDLDARQRLDQSGIVGPHMLSRAVVVTTTGSLRALAALAKATTLCLSRAIG